MDRFRELSAFIAVAEAGGFSAAGRRTGESQSALSKSVGALEARLGTRLFIRNTRSVVLTDQGQRYYDLTQPLLEEMAEADNELSSNRLDVSGTVRIAAASTFGRLHVLPLIPQLLASHPGLRVDLILSDARRDMVDDRVDLAIRVGPLEELDVVAKYVASTPIVCVGSRDYFARFGVPGTPGELAEHNCLVYGGTGDTTRWPFMGPEGAFSVPVSGNLASNSVEAVHVAVRAGVGIGLFTRAALVDDLKNAALMTVLDDFTCDPWPIHLIWPSRRFVPFRVRQVTEFFNQALRKSILMA